mmetsp:Transcript_39338/g.57876  ORF Transcript_39338/g.57876 Transcript_39338/m.57876 type:complete len:654 (-) Transcript_39338:40-2001(-)|eukprot:CAMPEP_0195541176 /NCGR_PEP_ID=MMETSP0794_2-20130614/50949_1 /TAXON_ID=515487 /ORGANISM="Stephanopyxis turris, Strain CCMP 815" /LENGTH=653 /DNA_ID=CAMNT_0040675261 /DNA_START=174 /DNA_END=2135 /DNA_ORIENTATION=-
MAPSKKSKSSKTSTSKASSSSKIGKKHKAPRKSSTSRTRTGKSDGSASRAANPIVVVPSASTPPPSNPRIQRIVILDSGGWTIKHGTICITNAKTKEEEGEKEESHNATKASSSSRPRQVPNATAKLKHQIANLIGDEINTVKDKSQLEISRPIERGYCVNLGLQLTIWKKVLEDEGISPRNSYNGNTAANVASTLMMGTKKKKKKLKKKQVSSTEKEEEEEEEERSLISSMSCGCLVLTQPFTPSVISEGVDEVMLGDLGFGVLGKVLVQCMAAYRYISGHLENRSNDCLATDGTECCCVVDSGFSFTHVVPTVGAKAIENAIRRVNIGGKLLTNHLKEIVSYRQWNMMDEFPIVNEAKERLCYLSTNFEQDLRNARYASIRSFDREMILPDFVRTFHGVVQLPAALLRQQCEKERIEREAAEAEAEAEAAAAKLEADLSDKEQTHQETNNNATEETTTNKPPNTDHDDFESDEETETQRQKRIHAQKVAEQRRIELEAQERQILSLSTERFTVPELLFHPSDVTGLTSQLGIVHAIVQSIEACDATLRAAMYYNVLLIGGNSKFPFYKERIEQELRSLAPSQHEVRVILPNDSIEYAWKGARLFALQKNFMERYCVERMEWEEANVNRKNAGQRSSLWKEKGNELKEQGLK